MRPSIEEIHTLLTGPGETYEVAETIIDGVRTRFWKNAPADLARVLRSSASHGERTFLVYENERIRFDEHFARAAWLSHRLRDEFGVRPGDRVAIAMRNLPEWPIAFWAIAAAGGVVVPLNAWWTGAELEYALVDSGAKVLFADAERWERLAPHLPVGCLEGWVVVRAGKLPEHTRRFEDLVRAPPPGLELPEVAIQPDDHATLFYTSGTTGRPRGVVGSHRNICTNLWSVGFARARTLLRSGAPRSAVDQPEENPAFLLSVPFFHVTGCHSILLSTTALGAKLVLMHKWSPERALELIERERITTFGGVPAMAWEVLESPEFPQHDTSSLRSVRYGGAPAPPELVRRIDARLPGRTPSNGYGMTETSAITSTNAGEDYRERPDSVGVPVPVCDACVVDSEGRELPRGEIGELRIRGPNVVSGYWNQPEVTAASFTDGWVHTGDLARMDEEGFIYVVDRAKDVVIRGGENVYCTQVERVLFEHRGVLDAAVIGVPHRVLGEEVGAVIVPRPGAVFSEQDIRDHVAANMAAYNIPAHVWVRDRPLPRNPAGKVLKRELKRDLVPPG